MNEDKLKKYLNEIEQLNYASRLPEHATLFKNKAIISKMLWDVHLYNAKKFYKESNKIVDQVPSLEKNGYITGELNQEGSLLLKEIFSSCKQMPLDPFEFSFDYVYEPRENLHGDMKRVNNYFQPSEFFFNRFQELLNPLKVLIETENQFYWKVASCRIFEVKPVDRTQGFHKDAQALGVKKLFFFPDGANKKVGSTNIIDKNGNEIIIDLKPGSWLLFENSLCEHQAYSSEDCVGRPTIEIDIMCDFITDTKLNYTGVNSWYPWFPILDGGLKTSGKFDYDEIYDRNLKRLAGLCNISKTDTYTFPYEMSDFYEESSEIFSVKPIAEKVTNSGEELLIEPKPRSLKLILSQKICRLINALIKK